MAVNSWRRSAFVTPSLAPTRGYVIIAGAILAPGGIGKDVRARPANEIEE
jgi:hypothetical protein